MKEETIAVILAGGMGIRFQEVDGKRIPKVLRPLLGKPMIDYVVEAAREAGVGRIIVVVGYKGEEVAHHLGGSVEVAWQERPMGTGHAMAKAVELLGDDYEGHVLALCGDTPLLTGKVLSQLISHHEAEEADATILTVELPHPKGYGRIIRGPDGGVVRIVEEKDASEEEKRIKEVNTGTYCFRVSSLAPLLPLLSNSNAQGEYYLTDVIGLMVERGMKVSALLSDDPDCVVGVNNFEELERAEELLRAKIS